LSDGGSEDNLELEDSDSEDNNQKEDL